MTAFFEQDRVSEPLLFLRRSESRRSSEPSMTRTWESSQSPLPKCRVSFTFHNAQNNDENGAFWAWWVRGLTACQALLVILQFTMRASLNFPCLSPCFFDFSSCPVTAIPDCNGRSRRSWPPSYRQLHIRKQEAHISAANDVARVKIRRRPRVHVHAVATIVAGPAAFNA